MKVKATISFAGTITMAKNEVRECSNDATLQDLLKCGHVIPAEQEKKAVKSVENKRSNSSKH